MLQGEHSVILATFIKLPFVTKIFVWSIFEWPLKTGFTVHKNIKHENGLLHLHTRIPWKRCHAWQGPLQQWVLEDYPNDITLPGLTFLAITATEKHTLPSRFMSMSMFCLRFYIPVYGHVKMVSSPDYTFSTASLTKRLTKLCAHTFACN